MYLFFALFVDVVLLSISSLFIRSEDDHDD
jgi:hypothetical protein